MINKRILYLYSGNHPVHLAFARSINANVKKLSWNIPKNYDIYFTEARYPIISVLKVLKILNKNSKIINLFADPRLYYINKNEYVDYKTNSLKKYPFLKSFLSKILLKKLDGVICVGNFEAKLFRKINKKTPMRVAYAFVSGEMYKRLSKIHPKINSQRIIFIGHGPDYYYKGVDILVKIFKKIKEKFPKSELHIVGEWKIKKEWKTPGIFFEGSHKSIEKFLSKSCLMIHLGRGDTFPVTTLEGMNAGIPVMVSEDTGTKEIVEKVEKKNVLPLKEKEIINRVKEYFKLPIKDKEELSKKFRKASMKFVEKRMVKDFRKKFYDLLEEIYKNKKEIKKML